MRGTVVKRLRRLAINRDRGLLTALVKVAGRKMQTIQNAVQLYKLAKKCWKNIKYEIARDTGQGRL